jgi:hypothetical protein
LPAIIVGQVVGHMVGGKGLAASISRHLCSRRLGSLLY